MSGLPCVDSLAFLDKAIKSKTQSLSITLSKVYTLSDEIQFQYAIHTRAVKVPQRI